MKQIKWFFAILAIAGLGLGASAFIGKDKAPEKKMFFPVTVYWNGDEWVPGDPGGLGNCDGDGQNCKATITLISGPGLDNPEDVANETLPTGTSPFNPAASSGESAATNTRTVNLNGSVYQVVIDEKV